MDVAHDLHFTDEHCGFVIQTSKRVSVNDKVNLPFKFETSPNFELL